MDPNNVAIDYFTVTAKKDVASDKFWLIAANIMKTLKESGLRGRPWRFFGYQGFVYSHKAIGHFAYGESPYEEQGIIIQSSGNMADLHAEKFLLDGSRWSRIDLTVDVEASNPDVAINSYEYALANGSKNRKYSLIVNSLGGQTLYVGSRSSDEFGRLYDKSAELESGEIGSIWRYEVELKSGRAKQAVKELAAVLPIRLTRSAAIATTVYDWFSSRAVNPVFSRIGGESLDLALEAAKPDDEQKLIWLRKQVSPTVRGMLSEGSVEVLEALGILDFFQVRPVPREKR